MVRRPAFNQAESGFGASDGMGSVFGLDLVRAVAIFLVLLCHCAGVVCRLAGWTIWQPLAEGGLHGVQVFFVLSGFLVGRIMLRMTDAPALLPWWRFMLRRWLRTLPLYYAWMAVMLVIWPPQFWLPDPLWLRRGAVAAVYAVFAQNVFMPMGYGEWFSVSWSLAVEEWFYLGFSALLLAGTAWFGRRRTLPWLLAGFCVLPALARAGLTVMPDTPKLVVTSLDQIAFGVMMAWISLAAPARFSWAARLLPAGLALIAVFWPVPAPGLRHWPALHQALGFDGVSLGAALCLPAMARWRAANGACAHLVRWLAARSYGFYITHLTLLQLGAFYVRNGTLPLALACVLVPLLIIAVPALSWRYLERPALRLRPALLDAPDGPPAVHAAFT